MIQSHKAVFYACLYFCIVTHLCKKTHVRRGGTSHLHWSGSLSKTHRQSQNANMPMPLPPGTFGVSFSIFYIYTHSQMISSSSMTFHDKLFPNLYLQPGPPLEHLRPGQIFFFFFFANLCLYKQFESPIICLSAPFWWPNFTQSWKDPAEQWSDPPGMTPSMVHWHFQLPQAPEGTLKSWRKSVQSLGPQRYTVGPVACFSWMKGTLFPASNYSKFQTCQKSPASQHITIHQSNNWHIYMYSFLNKNIHIHVHIMCRSVSILSPQSYTAKWSPQDVQTITIMMGGRRGGSLSNPTWSSIPCKKKKNSANLILPKNVAWGRVGERKPWIQKKNLGCIKMISLPLCPERGQLRLSWTKWAKLLTQDGHREELKRT